MYILLVTIRTAVRVLGVPIIITTEANSLNEFPCETSTLFSHHGPRLISLERAEFWTLIGAEELKFVLYLH